MSKLLHPLAVHLRTPTSSASENDAVSLEGVRKLISNDESFLLSLAVAEFADSLRLVADSVSRLSKNCHDPTLRSFHRVFTEFANSGLDPHAWTLTTPKDIETKHRKLQHYVILTATLHKEIDALTLLESAFKKALLNTDTTTEQHKKLNDLQQKIFWQKQEVKNLKDRSLWNKNFDGVVLLLARFVFTVLARIKVVFGIGHSSSVPFLSRSLSSVYPSDHQNPISNSCSFVSGPLKRSKLGEENEDLRSGFFESNCKVLRLKGDVDSDDDTLGASALALHYANLVMVLEKMIKSPQLVGVEARDDLYGMLPSSIRSCLRARLRGVHVGFSACDDHVLAGEWRDALGRILGWLGPLAHNMIKWQSERSYEHQNLVPKTNVLLLQTLFFANKEKTEAAITELLVGLNYVWRFEREMTAKALFQCTNFNGLLSLHKPC
ncbi:hypothetical protein GLYMA_09G152900v4 [Glycine max]|uniref:DUF668 domain-containing protein n=1 Tax=Glycine max TaxID=3847 RepID=I1L3K0_SOYBN|nr:hypothetical protein GLYMA_09G152900v4 [Glycine max]